MRWLKRLSIWVLLCLAAQLTAAPSIDAVRFRNFGLSSGLSQVTVRAIAEDARGFVWLGTQDGLNRFDGYDFIAFHRDRSDPGSIGDSHMTALSLAANGDMWIGTLAGGLTRLTPSTRQFLAFRHGAGSSNLASDNITALRHLRDGSLLVGTGAGIVQRLAPGSSVFETLWASEVELGVIRSIVEDDEAVWLAGSNGLWHWQDGQLPVRFGAELAALDDIQALSVDRMGGVFVGSTRQGLLQVSTAGNIIEHFRSGSDGGLPDDQVRALLTTRNGQLWVGTMTGLAVLNPDNRRFLTWRHDVSDTGSPAGNRIATIHESRDGLILVGTWTGGLSIHDPATQVVRLIRAHGRDNTSLPGNPVRTVSIDANGSLWMGVLEGGGLVNYDPVTGVRQRFVHDPGDPQSLASNAVQAIAHSNDGAVWVGTQGGGLSRLRDGKFEHFRREPSDASSIPDDAIQCLFLDRSNTLWVGTENGGLARWRGEGLGFERFQHQPDRADSLPGNSIYFITETRSGEFFLGTFGAGLVRMDRAAGTFEQWREIPGDLSSISHNSITMIHEARDGTLWIGTQGGGLNRATRAGPELLFESIGKRQGLGADAIGTVIEDRSGLIWIGTTVGVNAYDPQNRLVRTFSASAGMDRSGYFIGSVVEEPGGAIYFGGLRGALVFDPERLPQRPAAPRVTLTELKLNNGPARLAPGDDTAPLQLDIADTQALTLPHTISSLTIGFSALDMANPEGIRYRYRLDGFDSTWIADAGRSATYTNLPVGKYTFNVMAIGDESDFLGPIRRLDITLLPPWWRLPTMLIIYALMLLTAALLVWRRAHARWERDHVAAEAVARSEQRLKLALWASRDEMWDIDLRSGTMERENTLAVLGTRTKVSYPTQESFLEYVHEADRANVLRNFEGHVSGETEFYESTFRYRSTENEWRWILSRGFAVERDASGKALRLVGTSRDVTESAEAAEALRRLNDELEARVQDRTAALSASNLELQESLEEIHFMQRQLVESEKMAALGNLVAGIAHEINTPIGIGITAASHLEDETSRLMQLMNSGKLSKSALDAFQTDAISSVQLILSNLRRAGQLVRSFKQVAVDQSTEEAREIAVKRYLEEVLLSLGPALKKTRHQVQLRCPDDLVIFTYPGALSQIVVNLVMNSLIHGFDSVENGEIRIEANQYGDEWLLLYRDNGVGMSDVVRQRVFDPFFTTKRGQGGTGLGLHVVFNLITQLLRGSVDCRSAPGAGVEFQIVLPLRVR